jgi:aldehyde:ferredoxin oxidoreductase
VENITSRGYMGKVLRVDLSRGSSCDVVLDGEIAKRYIGGSALGLWYLYNEVTPEVEWSNPKNRFIVMSGPLGGTVGGTGGYSIITKGPMTNGAASTQGMGYWGAFIKTAGFDGIIVQGAAKDWVYLYIHDGAVEIRDARHLVGKNTWEVQTCLEKDLGKSHSKFSAMTIGPAGENLIRFACVVSDRGHVAAHNGVGAVMGSKRLKAIVVERGNLKVKVWDRKLLNHVHKGIMEKMKESPLSMWQGTQPCFIPFGKAGIVPVKNYTTADWTEYEGMDATYYRQHTTLKRETCWGCPYDHLHVIRITEGPYKDFEGEEPEYEGMAGCGSLIGNKDPFAAIVLNNETDWLGLDVNESTWLIAWLMECYEEGLFTSEDLDGLEMKWGDIESSRKLLRKIAYREGIGDILAEGVMRAAMKMGGKAEEKAIFTKKGNTPRCHDHRTIWNTIIDTATSSMGTDEVSTLLATPEVLGLPKETNRGTPDGAALINAAAAKKGAKHLLDSLLMCYVHSFGSSTNDLLSLLTATTGWSGNEFSLFGLMVNNFFRSFSIKHGHTASMDEPSLRYGSLSLAGPGKGKSILADWGKARQSYYEAMGWDKETGKPLPETLEQLGLSFVIPDLWH